MAVVINLVARLSKTARRKMTGGGAGASVLGGNATTLVMVSNTIDVLPVTPTALLHDPKAERGRRVCRSVGAA